MIYDDFPFNSLSFKPAMFDYQTAKTRTQASTTEMHGICPVKFPEKNGAHPSVPSQNLPGRSTGWPPQIHS